MVRMMLHANRFRTSVRTEAADHSMVSERHFVFGATHQVMLERIQRARKAVRGSKSVKRRFYDKVRRDHQFKFYNLTEDKRNATVVRYANARDALIDGTECGRFDGDPGVMLTKVESRQILTSLTLQVAGWAAVDAPSPLVLELFRAYALAASGGGKLRGKLRFAIRAVVEAIADNPECDHKRGKLEELLRQRPPAYYNFPYIDALPTPANARPPLPRIVRLGM